MNGIASLAKVVTAAGLLKLVETTPGMSLDDPAGLYHAPALLVHYPPGPAPLHCPPPCVQPPITLRHLITHASGVPNLGTIYPAGANIQSPSQADLDQMLVATTLEFYPGYNRDYSGIGMSIAGRIIELSASGSGPPLTTANLQALAYI